MNPLPAALAAALAEGQAEGLAEGLADHRWLDSISWFDEIDSTQRVALERADAGAEGGRLIIAERQGAGRGRNGRHWFSPPAAGLWFSMILRPMRPRHEWPILTSLAALTIRETLAQGAEVTSWLKWPNDLVCGKSTDFGSGASNPNRFFGRKIAGLLADGTDQGRAVVLGMGINVNQTLDDYPAPLRDIATSVRIEKGTAVDRWRLLSLLLNIFTVRYERFIAAGAAAVLPELINTSPLIGRRVGVNLTGEPGGQEVSGYVRSLGPLGELMLTGDDNEDPATGERPVTGGRLNWVSPPFLEDR